MPGCDDVFNMAWPALLWSRNWEGKFKRHFSYRSSTVTIFQLLARVMCAKIRWLAGLMIKGKHDALVVAV